MGQLSKIEWTDHTFNPWWGCMKVSEGCKNCYAETLDNRYHHDDPHWGPGSSRKAMSENYWKQPLKWNKEAEKAGNKARVFCASMADVFEHHHDTYKHRLRLFDIIESTPNLIWQLLTKRPENIRLLTPVMWYLDWPKNVWIGTSVENQEAAKTRIPHLLKIPSNVRFLSCEPLLGPLRLREYFNAETFYARGPDGQLVTKTYFNPDIHWVIAGGESGPGARPMDKQWLLQLMYDCTTANVPFFFKQWGEYCNGIKVGKHQAGRLLEGEEWNEFPEY
jgi:protein gp37